MSKCLVTKLKAVVDNPDLPILGEVKFHLKRVLTEDNIFLGATKSDTPIIATILGDNEVVFSENNSKTLTITSIYNNIKYKGGNVGDTFYMRIVSKYDMSDWRLQNNGGASANSIYPVFPAGTLKYHRSIINIGSDNSGIQIPISDLVASGNTIQIIHNGGTCIISGNYEEYLETIWSNGRKSGKLNFERTLSRSMFPHAPSELGFDLNKSASANFTVDGINVSFWNHSNPAATTDKLATATYDGSAWSYQME